MATLRYTVEFDWANDGEFAHPDSDVSAAAMMISTKRGSSGIRDIVVPGQASIVLKNDESTFDLFGDGELLTHLVPGRAVRIETEILDDSNQAVGAAIPIFYGFVTRYSIVSSPHDAPTINIEALDALDSLRYGKISTEAFEGLRADELIHVVLDAAGWPESRRSIQQASPKAKTTPFFWGEDITPAAALREASKSDPGGTVWVKTNGDIAFANSRARHLATIRGTLSDEDLPSRVKRISSVIDREDVFDLVSFAGSGYGASSTATGTTIIFVDTPGARILPEGKTTVTAGYTSGARDVIQPRPTLDYTANTLATGQGSDRTSLVVVTDWEARGAGFTVEFTNTTREVLVLRGPGDTDGFVVRGQAVAAEQGHLVRVKPDAPIATDRIWEDSWQFFSDEQQLARFARYRSHVYSQLQRRGLADIDLSDVAGQEFPRWMLEQDIGDKVRVKNTRGLNPSNIDPAFDGDMVVDYIEMRVRPPGGYTDLRWGLLSEDLALASGGVVGRNGLGSGKRATW